MIFFIRERLPDSFFQNDRRALQKWNQEKKLGRGGSFFRHLYSALVWPILTPGVVVKGSIAASFPWTFPSWCTRWTTRLGGALYSTHYWKLFWTPFPEIAAHLKLMPLLYFICWSSLCTIARFPRCDTSWLTCCIVNCWKCTCGPILSERYLTRSRSFLILIACLVQWRVVSRSCAVDCRPTASRHALRN